MSATRRALWLAVAAAVLGITWLVIPATTPPIYDVVTLREGPYRWLQPPPGTKATKRPTSARLAFAVGTTTGADLETGERQIPQARLIVLGNRPFVLPRSVKTVILTIRPIVPPKPLPAGTLDGNVYNFAAVTPSGAHPALAKNADTDVELYAAIHHGNPVIERYTGAGWQRLTTGTFIGTHVYITQNLTKLGDFVLVLPGTAATSNGGTSILAYVFAAIAVVALVVLAVTLFGLFRQRSARA